MYMPFAILSRKIGLIHLTYVSKYIKKLHITYLKCTFLFIISNIVFNYKASLNAHCAHIVNVHFMYFSNVHYQCTSNVLQKKCSFNLHFNVLRRKCIISHILHIGNAHCKCAFQCTSNARLRVYSYSLHYVHQ